MAADIFVIPKGGSRKSQARGYFAAVIWYFAVMKAV
jgi:hypothetical protein